MIAIPSETLITVYGGSGFVGRHVVRALARAGYRIRVAARRPELAGHLQPLGRVGQIHAVQANVRDHESVVAAGRGAAALINLVGILSPRGKQTFEAVHVAGAESVAKVAKDLSAKLVHVSALVAKPDSPARYARSNAEGERAVQSILPAAAILRPSTIFGPEDTLFNRFAALAVMAPALPLIGGGLTRFQPVFVGDVAAAVLKVIDGAAQPGRIYELGGPDVRSIKELLAYTLQVIGRRRPLVPVPFAIARVQAAILQYLPGRLLNPDEVDMLHDDSVVSDAAKIERRTLEGMGIDPVSFEAIAPSYLWRFRKTGQFHDRVA